MTDNNESIIANRLKVKLQLGEYIQYEDEVFKITDIIDFKQILGINIITNKSRIIKIDKITAIQPSTGFNDAIIKDDSAIGDELWKIAEERYKIIKPLLNKPSRKEVEAQAEKEGIFFTTIYNWIRAYKETDSILSLVPRKRGWKEDKLRISPQLETIIQEALEKYYLTVQKPSPTKVIQDVMLRCNALNIPPPHPNTVRNRIAKISDYHKLKRRGNKNQARDRFSPAAGTFPNANYPLAVVQVDHTPLDIMIVDDEHRLSIGRPYLTLAIDVFSRMVVGYYLSLDSPSELSVGMCLVNCILPKDPILSRLNIDASWDVWGVMNTVHVDNGPDFRSNGLARSCKKYGIHIEFRPVGGANFGGHIERLFGSFAKEIHAVPGTTFSNIKQKGAYKSEDHASLTFSELEKWLVTLITKYYHKRIHSSLDISPQIKWEQAIFGIGSDFGVGLPNKPSDPQTLKIDFLPVFERTIQRSGITIEGINYYSDVLRIYIGSYDTGSKKRKSFIFKRDPRDISYIWFYDEESKKYYKVPTANQAFPPISIWEFREVQKRKKEQGKSFKNDYEIIEAIRELRELAHESSLRTKKTRRLVQKRKLYETTNTSNTPPQPSYPSVTEVNDIWGEPIESYEDIQ